MKLVAILALAAVAFVPKQSGLPKDANLAKDAILTSNSVIPLSNSVDLWNGLQLTPGLRAIRTSDGYSVSSYSGAGILLESSAGTFTVSSPSTLRLTDQGWEVAGRKVLPNFAYTARAAAQDDTDSNLKSMQESAKKLKTKSNANQDENQQPGKKLRVRWLFGENPMPTAELFNTPAIQQMTHLSAIGF